jgi:hypothetical protein
VSFTYSFLAAKCELSELQEALLAAWPTLEIAEAVQTFASWDDAFQWASPRCGYLAGTHPHDVKLLYRDGIWSVLADISTCMVEDKDSLADLSRRVGRVVAATTQGTAGFAQLLVLEAGAPTRSITGQGGHITEATGAAIAEEAGVPLGAFYLNELDTIWHRLGLSSFLNADPVGPVVALHVLDRTPMPESAPAPNLVRRRESRPRPSWKLW